MKISKRIVASSDEGYRYITKHGLGPGTLPDGVELIKWEDLDNYKTAIWLSRPLTKKELDYFDIYPEYIQSARKSDPYDFCESLKKELSAALHDFMVNRAGFPEDEADEYSGCDVSLAEDAVVADVWAELSFDATMDLQDTLNKIVEKYDDQSYFDNEAPGRISAWLYGIDGIKSSEEFFDKDVKEKLDFILSKYFYSSASYKLSKDGKYYLFFYKDYDDEKTHLAQRVPKNIFKKSLKDIDLYFNNINESSDFLDRKYEKELNESSKESNEPLNGRTSAVEINTDAPIQSASYGGAYDIEDDQYFTKDDIVEFGYDVVDRLNDEFGNELGVKFDLYDVYMDTPTLLHLTVCDEEGTEASADIKIDMRRIKYPRDLKKYETDAVVQIEDDYKYATGFDDPVESATNTTNVTSDNMFIDEDSEIYAYYEPEQPLEPDDPIEYVDDDETVAFKFHAPMIIKDSTEYDFQGDTYPDYLSFPNHDFKKSGRNEAILYSELFTGVALDDAESIIEHIQDYIADYAPTDPGTYDVYAQGKLGYTIYHPDYRGEEYYDDEYDEKEVKFDDSSTVVTDVHWYKVD